MNDNLQETIAKNIRYYREESGLSQKELACKISVTQQYLSAIEKGKRQPTVDILLSLAEALNVSYVSLLSLESDFHSLSIDITPLYVDAMNHRPEKVRQVMERALQSNNSQIIVEIELDDKTWEAYNILKDTKTLEEFGIFMDANGLSSILRMPLEYVWLKDKYEEYNHDVDKVQKCFLEHLLASGKNPFSLKKGLPLHINVPVLCMEDTIWYWFLIGMIKQKEKDRLLGIIAEKKKKTAS